MRPRLDRDRSVAALAGRQYGIVTRAELRALGLPDRAVARRIAAGRLIPLHRGVYAVGHDAVPLRGRWLAAVRACGPTAVLSHGTAAALWELAEPPRLVHVTVRSHMGRTAPAGVRLHRSVTLADEDVVVREGIPVTSVARTLLDQAPTLPLRRLRRAFAQADVLRLLDFRAVDRLVAAHPRRAGMPKYRAAAAEHRPEGGISRSDFEDRLAELCERHGLPRPEVNARVAGLEVDLWWPRAAVVAEADGFAFHRTRAAFERDRERDAILTAAGIVVHRFTDRQVRRAPETVVAALRRSLSDRGRIAS
jgi:very-short-patch-repair endonuclease